MIALFLTLAFADIAPPDAEDCYDKKVGDPCRVGGEKGTCVEATRTRQTPEGPVDSAYVACQVPEGKDAGGSTSRCQTAPGWPWLALSVLPLLRRRARATSRDQGTGSRRTGPVRRSARA